MEWASAAGIGIILVIGSALQRVTGMGLALVASPFLTLVIGPDNGVLLLQAVGFFVCATSAWTLRADLNWAKAGILFLASMIGLLPGIGVAKSLPSSVLSISVGIITVIALALIMLFRKSDFFAGRRGLVAAGSASGFMNVTAGVGGPPLVIYAASSGWKYQEYVATVQILFAGMNLVSLAGRGLPSLSAPLWIVAALSAVCGLIAGNLAAEKINEQAARTAILVIAFIGAVAAIVRGISML